MKVSRKVQVLFNWNVVLSVLLIASFTANWIWFNENRVLIEENQAVIQENRALIDDHWDRVVLAAEGLGELSESLDAIFEELDNRWQKLAEYLESK